jgi:colicin import membrane protein
MTGPSLQKTALLSFGLHVMVFLLAFLILKQSNRIIVPSPYTVDLVSPGVLHRSNKGKIEDAARESGKTAALSEAPEKSRKEKAEEKARETELIRQRIAALQKNKEVENEIADLAAKRRRMAELRRHHEIISVKAAAVKRGDGLKTNSSLPGKGTIFDAYYARITGEIWRQWHPPDTGRKDIEAIVSVKISRDGTAIVQKIEKSSGNALFDRSVRLAIARANPLSRPPYEMEIGVRFYP